MMMEENIDRVESIIRKWDIDAGNLEQFSTLFVEDRKEAKLLLEAAISLQKIMQDYVKESTRSEMLIKGQKLLKTAMKRLEREFYTILSANRKNLDSESVSSRSSKGRSSTSNFCDDDEVSGLEENMSITTPRTPIISPHTPITQSDTTIISPHTGIISPRTPITPSCTSSTSSTPRTGKASEMAMMDLKNIADCMIVCGYGKECINSYKIIRKSIIDETLDYIGVEIPNYEQLRKMEWTVLDRKIEKWVHALHAAVKTLFPGEKVLCEIVFASSEKTAESCFNEICKDAAISVFNFPEKFSKCKKILSTEKIFRTLDMYQAISFLWPEIETIFSTNALAPVRVEAIEVLVKLSEAVRIMLVQFEVAIQKDSSKSPACGGLHSLTTYVVDYLLFLGDYSAAISYIVEDWPLTPQTPPKGSHFLSPKLYSEKGCRNRFEWLFCVFLCKLDSKAAQYHHMELSYLFLMNNVNYVVSKVRDSILGLVMGPDWIKKYDLKVTEFLVQYYENAGWSKVVSSLPEDPAAGIPLKEAKQCFKRFSTRFQEAYGKQSSWVVPDPKLRYNVRFLLAKMIVPNYQVFYEKYVERYGEVGSDSIVRYLPQELETCVLTLFCDA